MANSCIHCSHCREQAGRLEDQAKRMEAFEAAVNQLKRLGYVNASFEQTFTHALWISGGQAGISMSDVDDDSD